MRSRTLKLMLAGSLWLWGPLAYGQAVPATVTKTPTSVGLSITVLAQPRQVDVPGSFKMTFAVQNTTTQKIILRDFLLESVEAPTPLVVSEVCTSVGQQKSIEANDFYTITCTIATPDYADSFFGFFSSMVSRWTLLTLAPGEYQFVATANARGADANQEAITISTSRAIPVRMSPTVWQAIFGAMLGSLLMVVFWLSSPRVRAQVGVDAAGMDGLAHILQSLGRAAALWCGSTTAAAISIFLTFRMKDASLPFTLSVNDFYGGLVVGLFGVVLTNWLGPKLFGNGNPPAGEPT